MFALLVHGTTPLPPPVLDQLAARLPLPPHETRVRQGRGALALAQVAGTLPEDVHDHQPLLHGSDLLVARIRLDRRPELIRRLQMDPAEAATCSDADLLARSWQRWGTACVDHLYGDFAFAVWDADTGTVFAAVDPLGIYRLHWAVVPGGLLVSTELPLMLAHPSVSRTPDFAAMALVLDRGVDRASTPFSAVRALPGGHSLVWRHGSQTPVVTRWWQPQTRACVWHPRPDDYVEEASALLRDAVTSRLRSSTPVASMLSGGLDSGLVSAEAARQLKARGERLLTFTAVPEPGLACELRPGWDADDSPHAAAVVAHHGNIDPHWVRPGPLPLLQAAETLHRRALTPMKGQSNLAWLDQASRMARERGVRVMLEGQSGNAGISWSGDGALRELWHQRRLALWLHSAREQAQVHARPLLRLLAGSVVPAHWRAPPDLPSAGLAYVHAHRRPAISERHALFGQTPGTRACWVEFVATPRNGWRPDPLSYWDVDWRDPLADRTLLETLLTYPQLAFRPRGQSRGLAREVARGLLPESVRLRQSRGAQMPELVSLLQRDWPHINGALRLVERSSLAAELLDMQALQRDCQRLRHGGLDMVTALGFDRALGIGLFLARLEHGELT